MKKIQRFSYQSAGELVAALANKHISSVQLLDETISRIEIEDKKINAVTTRDFVRARAAAIAADAAIARGERKTLLGLPMTVKESFNIAGLTTSWGSHQFKDWRPDSDSLVISRLKSAGAIIIGKTNVPCMLADYQTYNDIHGITNNPWNLDFTPGGSSGGSAAALAAGFVALELGSDLAGSLRVPAHYCGVYAHKPSSDLIPLRGAGSPTTLPTTARVDLAVAGPMARTAKDLVIALGVLAGPDELSDGAGYTLSLPKAKHNKLQDYRVLILDYHPLYPTEIAISKAIANLAERLMNCGVNVSLKHSLIPNLAEIARNYSSLLSARMVANMSSDSYLKMEAEVKQLSKDDDSLAACYLRGGIMNHRDWLLATKMRDQLRMQWKKLYNEFDVVICPVMPTVAFPHNHSPDQETRRFFIDGVQVPYSHQYIWACIATLFGLPATAAPIDLTENDLPIGIQIIGDYLQDYTTIKFAELLESEWGRFPSPCF